MNTLFRSVCCWLGCASLLLSGACTSQPTESGSGASSPDSAPAYTQSLEPTLPEAVSRIYQRSCQACHGPDGQGIAAVAPALPRAKPRTLEQWKQYLTQPQSGHPGVELPPPTWINVDEIEVMAGYLFSLAPVANAATTTTTTPEAAAIGASAVSAPARKAAAPKTPASKNSSKAARKAGGKAKGAPTKAAAPKGAPKRTAR